MKQRLLYKFNVIKLLRVRYNIKKGVYVEYKEIMYINNY